MCCHQRLELVVVPYQPTVPPPFDKKLSIIEKLLKNISECLLSIAKTAKDLVKCNLKVLKVTKYAQNIAPTTGI